MSRPSRPAAGVAARRLAAEALVRIDTQGAFANLLVPETLARSELDERDRAFATELVYGTTRMRRACDWLVDRFVAREPDAVARTWLRLGAYQLVFLGTPAHAAVSATVEAAPAKLRGFLNAVLRKVAAADTAFPDDATRLSYPDWVVELLVDELGPTDAHAALEAMNAPAARVVRADGYTQDLSSQWVARAVGARTGERVIDLAAAPGGKATAMAADGAFVAAVDLRPARAGLVAANARRLGLDSVSAVVGDGVRPPLRAGVADRVLLDAPCSGLGAFRRRPDARWRIEADAVDRLAGLQREMVDAAVALLAPGGVLVYSVCTLSRAETTAIDEHIASRHPELAPAAPGAVGPLEGAWRPRGRGHLILPQDAGTDGMYLLRLRAPDGDR